MNSKQKFQFSNDSERRVSDFEILIWESEERFKALVHAIKAMFWVTDAQGNNIVMSEAWCTFTGQTAEEVKKTGWEKGIHPEDLDNVYTIWRQAAATNTTYIAYYRLYCALDNRYHNTYSRGNPVILADGSVKEWIGVTMDIDSVCHYKEESDFMRKRFECLSNSLGHLMWYADVSGKFVFLNDTWKDLLGYTKEDIMQYGWENFTHPDDRDSVNNAFVESMKTGKFEHVNRLRCFDGSYKYILTRSQIVDKPEINLHGWMGSGVDITELIKIEEQLKNFNSDLEHKVNERTELLEEKKRELEQKLNEKREAEEILEESVNRYKTLSNISPVGIFHIDLSGEITYCNDYLLEMLGVKEFVEVKGKHWIDFISEEERLKVMKVWHEFTMKREEQSFHMEFRMQIEKCNVCHEYWVLCQIVKQKSERVTRMSFSGTMTNMTERKRLEKEKLEAMEKSNEVQERRWKEVERNIGLQDEFIDFMVHEIRNPLSIITLTSEMVQTQLDNLMSDVEQEKEEKSESIKVKEWINKNAKMKAKYEIFLKGMKEVMKNVDECATHERIICEDVLTYSKMEAGMLELEIVKCNAKEVMQNAVSLINKRNSNSNVSVCINQCTTVDSNLSEKIEVFADKNSLRRVFKIILDFSYRHCKQNIIHFHIVNSLPHFHSFEISYFGDAMSVEDLESASTLLSSPNQRFSQNGGLQKVKSKYISYQYTMSGLGLIVCCNLIKLMNGTLQVQSSETNGTKFRITIPSASLQQNEEEVQLENSSVPTIESMSAKTSESNSTCCTPTRPKTVKILIAEDNAVNAKIVSYFLSLKGYESEIVYNGLEALNKFVDSIHGKEEKSLSGDGVKKSEYDLILMDLEMPVMNGMESCKQIRKKEEEMGIKSNERIAIIALTGHFEPNTIDPLKHMGMDEVLIKPFKREDLYSAIETILLRK